MHERDRDAVRERYRKRWHEFGYHSRTLGWNKDCQWVRFEAALDGIRNNEMQSVLDVGCGFGDLLGFLRERGWQGRYTGIDLVPELVDAARGVYREDPAAEFVCGDVHEGAPLPKSELVLALGMFNHSLPQGNLGLIQETIAAMWEASSSVVVCDFLSVSSEPEKRQAHLFYADPAEVYRIGAAYSRRLEIHHAYMPFEFQLKLWRDDSFQAAAPVFSPYRSLALAQTEWRTQRTDRPGKGRP
jgi:SAM-dependent methyltransferase